MIERRALEVIARRAETPLWQLEQDVRVIAAYLLEQDDIRQEAGRILRRVGGDV